MRSLQRRLGLGLAAGLIGFILLQWWFVNVTVRSIAESYVGARLDHDADTLLAALDFSPEGGVIFDPQRIDGIYHTPFSGHYYRVQVNGYVFRSRSLWDEDLDLASFHAGKDRALGPQGQQLLLRHHRFDKRGRRLDMVVAEDITSLEHDLDMFELRYALGSLAVLVIVLGLQAWVTRRGLAPLDDVREDIRQLEQGEVRQLRDNVPTEIRPLVSEFNSLLEVMQQRLERSRTALGNLAHALKTPLTVITRLADDDVVREAPQLRKQLLQQGEVMRQIVDRQLKRARLAGAAAPGWRFKVKEEIDALIGTLQRIYEERGLELDARIPPNKVFSGDREDMLELFGNLLDNACKWARKRVYISIAAEPGLVCTVEDDGPGCPPEALAYLGTRGLRADESVQGHGLGLAIVSDIVADYGGEISFGQSEVLGGFAVRLRLPPQRLGT